MYMYVHTVYKSTHHSTSLFEGDESGGVCGSNARSAMFHWLVCDGELSQVVAHHLTLWNVQCTCIYQGFTSRMCTYTGDYCSATSNMYM